MKIKDGIFLYGSEITHRRLNELLLLRYRLCNYQPGRISIMSPAPVSGGCGYIFGPLAEELAEIHDKWNFEVYRKRAIGEVGIPGNPKPETPDAIQGAIQYWADYLKRSETNFFIASKERK